LTTQPFHFLALLFGGAWRLGLTLAAPTLACLSGPSGLPGATALTGLPGPGRRLPALFDLTALARGRILRPRRPRHRLGRHHGHAHQPNRRDRPDRDCLL
jgi:hypothetical protein